MVYLIQRPTMAQIATSDTLREYGIRSGAIVRNDTLGVAACCYSDADPSPTPTNRAGATHGQHGTN